MTTTEPARDSEETRPLGRRRKRLTREESKAETRAALLDAGERIFGRQGFFVTSVEEVAEEAGFSKGAVYSNFDSKDDLLMAIVERRLTERIRRVSEIADAADNDVEQQTNEVGQAFVDLLNADPDWVALMTEFWACLTRNPTLRGQFTDRYRAVRTVTGELIEKNATQFGVALPMSAEELAIVAFAMGTGIALEHVADPERVPNELFGRMLYQFFAGMAVPQEESPPDQQAPDAQTG
jgi:AcrR family transcriptional regulator